MILKLNDTYKIETDNKNVILVETKEVKDGERKGEKYFTNVGYYSNFKQAIDGCLKHGILNSEVEGLQDIQYFLEKFKEDVISRVELLEFEVTQ